MPLQRGRVIVSWRKKIRSCSVERGSRAMAVLSMDYKAPQLIGAETSGACALHCDGQRIRNFARRGVAASDARIVGVLPIKTFARSDCAAGFSVPKRRDFGGECIEVYLRRPRSR